MWQRKILCMVIVTLTGCSFERKDAAPVVDLSHALEKKHIALEKRKPTLIVEFPKTNEIAKSSHLTNDTWQWPVQGKITRYFSEKDLGLKGIDIAGKWGDKIKAARSGKVVYSGSGLRGYGQLVIIKHNETYLSAYGYNSRLLVKEGEMVTIGQDIAEMGAEGSENKLHFEIRKNGLPIDPLLILSA